MSTQIDEGLDTDLFSVLDFDYEVPCDFNRYSENYPSCELPAEWRVVISCCGRTLLFCDEHFNDMLDSIAAGCAFVDNINGCGKTDITNPITLAERLDKSR